MQDYFVWIDGMFSPFWALASVALLLLGSWFSGRLLMRRAFGFGLRNPALRLSSEIGMGMVALSLFALLSSMLGLLGPMECRVALLSLGGAGILFAIWRLAESKKRGLPVFVRRNWSFLIVFAAIGLLYLGNALCVPAGMSLDEQAYQLPVPWRWLLDGFPLVYADIPYSGYPMQPNFLFALVIGSGGLSAPRLLCLCLALLGFATLYFLLRKSLRPGGALAFSLFFQLSWTRVFFGQEAFVEPFTLYYFLCAFALFERVGKEDGKLPAAVLALGVFGGALAAVKLSSVMLVAFLGLGALFFHRGGPALKIRLAFSFALGSLAGLPYYLRVLWETGNPLHPYFGWIFSSDQAMIAMSRYYHYMGGSEIFGKPGFWNALLSPLRLACFDQLYGIGLGPGFTVLFVLSAAVVVIVLARRPRTATSARIAFSGISVFVLYILWLLGAPQTRFLEPVLALMILTVAAFAKGMKRLPTNLMVCALLCFCAYNAYKARNSIVYDLKMWRILAKGLPPSEQLKILWAGKGPLDAYAALAGFSKPDDVVMLLMERKILFCPRRYIQISPFFQARYFTPPMKEGQETMDDYVLKTVLESGAAYVLIREENYTKIHTEMMVADIIPILNSFARLANSGRLPVVWHKGEYTILAIPRKP